MIDEIIPNKQIEDSESEAVVIQVIELSLSLFRCHLVVSQYIDVEISLRA